MKINFKYDIHLSNLYFGEEHITWEKDNECHRENGPAIMYTTGYQEWFLNGKRHRDDGPAVTFADGSKERWINGNRYMCNYFEKDSLKARKRKPSCE